MQFRVLSPYTSEVITKSFDKLIDMGISSGDYLEFGVFQGHSLLNAYQQAKKKHLNEMRFFGFDSFSGFPEPEDAERYIYVFDEKRESYRKVEEKKGDLAYGKENVVRNLREYGVNFNKIHLIDGYYNDTLSNDDVKREYDIKEAAIVLIDCDLHSSALLALKFAKSLFRDKTIILLDDYNIYYQSDIGEGKIFREIIAEDKMFYPEPFLPIGKHGQSFILHKLNKEGL